MENAALQEQLAEVQEVRKKLGKHLQQSLAAYSPEKTAPLMDSYKQLCEHEVVLLNKINWPG